MDTSGLYASGILNEKSEELLEMKRGTSRGSGLGTLALTNKRFFFLQKPTGSLSKGEHSRLVGYSSNKFCMNGIESVKKNAPKATIVEL